MNTLTLVRGLPGSGKSYIAQALELGVQLQVVTVQGNFGSVHGVPETTMDKMKQRFEPFDLNYWLENHNETKRS